eukprot:TRINITY_DN30162_c0_g1_i1.p1 TRINITY_DN30162_c0_g1~~TRINITY_DN30162_c0_g1_i1.p1  ORF type:complete len:118 (+),score=21.72 TRINITY_DN30162_c0_g1_i1:139-492(+)
MVHYFAVIVKALAVVGATQVVGGALAGSDTERRAHGGLVGGVVGGIKGLGYVVRGTFENAGAIVGRLIPPRKPNVDFPHLVEAIVVVACGPAFLGLLYTIIYKDAKRERTLQIENYY